MKERKAKKVVISLWSAGSCGRKQLAGILRYVNTGKPWDTKFIMDPAEFDVEAFRRFESEGVDGYIAFVSDQKTAKALSKSKTPTVLLSFPTAELEARKDGLVRFVNDNETIGRAGAEHFLALGQFADYAFVPDRKGRGWSAPRGRAFAARLAEAGRVCLTYNGGGGAAETRSCDNGVTRNGGGGAAETRRRNDIGGVRDEPSLGQWLSALRKPAAVMAAFDFSAREVIMAAKAEGLSVPDDIAVLGVDDDELICETTSPALSSIRIDQEQIGYRAAQTLDALMRSKRPLPSRTLVIKSEPVVARESTRPLAPVVGLVRRIDSYLRAHWSEPISVADVAAALRVSRRLLDYRYHEATGLAIRKTIEDLRLTELKRLLRTTDLPISRLTRKCGFTNDLWVKYVFKRREGMTMTQYRKSANNGD